MPFEDKEKTLEFVRASGVFPDDDVLEVDKVTNLVRSLKKKSAMPSSEVLIPFSPTPLPSLLSTSFHRPLLSFASTAPCCFCLLHFTPTLLSFPFFSPAHQLHHTADRCTGTTTTTQLHKELSGSDDDRHTDMYNSLGTSLMPKSLQELQPGVKRVVDGRLNTGNGGGRSSIGGIVPIEVMEGPSSSGMYC
jgi:hypothetical protein